MIQCCEIIKKNVLNNDWKFKFINFSDVQNHLLDKHHIDLSGIPFAEKTYKSRIGSKATKNKEMCDGEFLQNIKSWLEFLMTRFNSTPLQIEKNKKIRQK